MFGSRTAIFQKLASLGAGEFAHLHGSLGTHLIAVAELLKEWGADESLCCAGLFHAAYGTIGFDQSMVSLDRRQEISALIGVAAEALVYTYCACDRMKVWPQIAQGKMVTFYDRFTGAHHLIEDRELMAFCELSCANELELAFSDAEFAAQMRLKLKPLFRQWAPFLSESAVLAVERAFPD